MSGNYAGTSYWKKKEWQENNRLYLNRNSERVEIKRKMKEGERKGESGRGGRESELNRNVQKKYIQQDTIK